MVLYFDNSEIWQTGTVRSNPAEATLLADGNFVLYDVNANVLWQSNTAGLLGQELVLQNDGNLVIYNPTTSPATAVWATNTCCH